MANQEVEIFVHSQGAKPNVVIAAPGDTLKDVLNRADVTQIEANGMLVFVGECEDALQEPNDVEDGADNHAPVDLSLTVEALELRRHRHVHCHRCHRIAAAVNFGGSTKQHKFSPATTVAVVTMWARKKFHLTDAAASELVLQLCNSTEQPRSDKHLGELIEATTCAICFDLVHEVTPQG